MSRRHLLPPGNEEYLERLGFTDQDKRVYISILDSGLVSVGEVVQLTNLTLSEVLVSVRDLVDLGMVKKALGRMPRYYASLPFFQETVTVERDTMYALDSMITSLNMTKKEILVDKNKVITEHFPKLMNKVLDSIVEDLLTPLISDIQELVKKVENDKGEYPTSIQKEHETIRKNIEEVINPLKSFAELQSQKFDISIIKEGDALDNYLIERKNQRVNILKSAHEVIGSLLKSFDEVVNLYSNDFQSLKEKSDKFIVQIDKNTKQLTEVIEMTETSVLDLKKTKDEILGEVIIIRERLQNQIAEEKPISSIDLQNEFDKLTKIIKEINIDNDKILTPLVETKELARDMSNSLRVTTNSISENSGSIANSFKSGIQDITDSIGDTLNSLNSKDEESINTFKEQLNTSLSVLGDSIKNEGREIKEKLDEHIENISERLNTIFSEWEKRLISYFNYPKENVAPFLDRWAEKLEPHVEEFKKTLTKFLEEILLAPLSKLEKDSFGSLTTRVQYIKSIMEGRSNDLQTIMNFSKTFDYTRSSDTWVVVGIPSIFATMSDLLLRTKTRVTIVTPKLSSQLLDYASNLKPTIRITFVADVDIEGDSRLINKINNDGRMILRKYPGRDLYACIRDSEEIIFGYEKEDEEIIGIRSSSPSMLGLLEDRLNETVIRNSKQI
ncbi:MAG: hypothetical protein HeimC2_12070 [Candidatus Heimdallarchaeota archaeon LC_2]|nr:MAG: hypothetical protein HeimC2_12070 [Candidatus Heimdallarchaeota archaeon LC_2]